MFLNPKNIRFRLLISGILFILGLFIIVVPRYFKNESGGWPVRAAASAGVRGWGWSENVGWLSMNCYNDYNNDGKFECCCAGGAGGGNCPSGAETCPHSLSVGNYGVDADRSSNYKLSGYAWSDKVGWVCFGETCLCADCTSCGNYATCTDCSDCSGCPNEVIPPAGQVKPWACVGKPTWNGGEVTCSGDKGEDFLNATEKNGHWKMNELGAAGGGCNKATDCTGDETSIHPAFLKPSLSTGPKQAIGKYSYALQFDGEDDYLEVVDATGISFTSSFTVEAWIKRGSIGTGTTGAQTILAKWDESIDHGKSYRLWFDNENKLNFSLSGNGTDIANTYQLKGICLGAGRKRCHISEEDCSNNVDICGENDGICVEPLCTSDGDCNSDEICKNAPIVDTKKWHHVAAKYVYANTPFVNLFIDGQVLDVKTDGTTPTSIYNSDGSLYFGVKKNSSGVFDTYFDGVMDNVSVWARPKPGDEIWDDARIEVAGWAKVVGMGDGGWLNLRSSTLGDRVWGLYLRDYKTFYTIGGYMAGRHNDEEMNVSGLKGQWKMNQLSWSGVSGEVIDGSGQDNHGTARNGATISDRGKFNNAGDFDGVNDYIQVPDDSSLDFSSALTIEAWFKADALGKEIICKSASNADENYRIFIGDNNYVYFDYGNASQYADTSAFTFKIGDWYHLATTVQAGQPGRIYLNGQEASSYAHQYAAPNPLLVNNSALQIGGCVFTDRYFDGLIDNVTVYNRVKTATEINSDYAKRIPYSVGWEDYDHDYSRPPAPLDFNTLTLSNNSGSCRVLLISWDISDWADSYTYYRCDDVTETDCGADLEAECGGGDGYKEYNYLGTCNEGERCLLADTGLNKNGNTGYCYKIKAHNETGSTWISNTPITYPAPQWISTTLCAPVPQEINTSVCGQMTPLWNAVIGADGYNVYRSLASNGCSSINSSTCELVGHLAEGLDYNADDSGIINDLIAQWKMNELVWEGSNNEVRDSSGKKNHGRAYNGATTTAEGWFDRAGVFDGEDDYVSVGKPPGQFNVADEFTVEAWINSDLDSSNDIIIGNAYEGSPGWHLRITSANKARFMLSEDNDNYKYVEMSSALTSGWHHLVGVWDGSNPSIYVDGKDESGEEHANVVTSGILTDIGNNNNTYIGNAPGVALYFDGKIDNVAVYNEVKSAEWLGLDEQIRVDYEAGNCGEIDGCGLDIVCHAAGVSDGLCGVKVKDGNYNTDTCCYADKRIIPFTTYYYVMTAVNEAGESPASSPVKSGQTKCFPASEMGEE